jgi:hypothetical protein
VISIKGFHFSKQNSQSLHLRYKECDNLISLNPTGTRCITQHTFRSQKVLLELKLMSIGKNADGSDAGTTNSIDPLSRSNNLAISDENSTMCSEYKYGYPPNQDMHMVQCETATELTYFRLVLSINTIDHSKMDLRESYLTTQTEKFH